MVNFPLAASIALSFRAASRAASVAEPVLGAGVSHLLARFRLQLQQENEYLSCYMPRFYAFERIETKTKCLIYTKTVYSVHNNITMPTYSL